MCAIKKAEAIQTPSMREGCGATKEACADMDVLTQDGPVKNPTFGVLRFKAAPLSKEIYPSEFHWGPMYLRIPKQRICLCNMEENRLGVKISCGRQNIYSSDRNQARVSK
jgi:hypothetical protein